MGTLNIFYESQQFEKKIKKNQVKDIQIPVEKMKNLALHVNNSKLESEEELDE